MQIHEQIYTSASELLALSQSGLGVVAESVGFPTTVASQLNALASYRILQDLPADDPKLHPSRIVAMPHEAGSWYSVSRIVYAGADYSGRTTPLAHHVLIEVSDLAQDRVIGDTIQALSNVFVDNWKQKPQIFDPPKSIDVSASQGSIHSIGEANLQQLANVTGWLAGRFVEGLESNSTSVVFILPIDQRDESLKLLLAIYRAIAPAKQSSLIFQSHVSSFSDLIGNAHVVATYPKSEYLNEIQSWPEKHRPTVVDLSVPSSSTFNNVGFASWFERKLNDNDSLQTTREGLCLRESLRDIDETKNPNGFSQVWDFSESIAKGNMMAHVDEIGKQSETLSAISPRVAEFVDELTNKAIRDHFKERQSDSDWHSLLQILVNNSWPKTARKLCLDAIAKMPEYSFPVALTNREAMRIPGLTQRIDKTFLEKPYVWKKLLQGEPDQAANCRQYLEGQVDSDKLPLSASKDVTEILIGTGNDSQQQEAARKFLTSPIQPQPIPVTHFEWLQSIAPEKGLLQRIFDSTQLPPQIAESLQDFLHPHAPPYPGLLVSTSSQLDVEFDLPRKQQPASSAFSIHTDYVKVRQIFDPRPLIRNTASIVVFLAILGSAVLAWGMFSKIDMLSTIMSWSAMAAVLFSLLTAWVASFSFSRNRMVNRQKPLMIFGFVSVALMIVSAMALLCSFIAPFLKEVLPLV